VKKISFAVVCALFLGLVFAAGATSKSPGVGILVGTGKQQSGREKRIRARVAQVTAFVAGQPSALLVSRMPKHAYLFVEVGPVQNSPACEHILCVPTFIAPDPNAQRAHFVRTNGRGRALINFTMPGTFEGWAELPSGKLSKVRQFPWQNGQAVQVIAAGAHINQHGDQITGVAAAKTSVQVPPPPPAP
jgi:hypothetical protein